MRDLGQEVYKDVTRDVERWIPYQCRIRKRIKFGIRNFCVHFINLFLYFAL